MAQLVFSSDCPDIPFPCRDHCWRLITLQQLDKLHFHHLSIDERFNFQFIPVELISQAITATQLHM